VVQPERVDDTWLDNLGNYLLRRRKNLYELEISDNDKAAIRQKLEQAERQRQQEMQQAIQREQEEQDEARRNSLLGKLKSFAKQGES
jgi:5-bromo-4-chloroindolyl phosphate hydrolysis protein